MIKLLLIGLFFIASCSNDNCVDNVCPYDHNACFNCEEKVSK